MSDQSTPAQAFRLPITGRRDGRHGVILAYAMIPNDTFGRELAKRRWKFSTSGYVKSVGRGETLHCLIYRRYCGAIAGRERIIHADGNRLNNLPGNLRQARKFSIGIVGPQELPPCPTCGSDCTIIRGRKVMGDGTHFRERDCKNCGERFKTVEASDVPLPVRSADRSRLRKAKSRWCRGCDLVLPVSEFAEMKNGSRRLRCRSCRSKARAAIKLRKTLAMYGMSVDEYHVMLKRQGGVCAICGQPDKAKHRDRLSVDHDHKTGKVRGLLCTNCNFAVGCAQDDPLTLERAAAYLRRHR